MALSHDDVLRMVSNGPTWRVATTSPGTGATTLTFTGDIGDISTPVSYVWDNNLRSELTVESDENGGLRVVDRRTIPVDMAAVQESVTKRPRARELSPAEAWDL